VEEVRVNGAAGVAPREVLGALSLKRGQRLDDGRLRLAREVALSLLQNRGYLDADASVRVDTAAAGARVTLELNEGALYRFGRTRFEGLVKLPEGPLLHELTYDRGDPYERPRLLRAQARLFGLGLFDDIDVSVTTTTAKTADVLIKVKERPLKWIKTGVGWGSEERERISAAVTHYNLFRRAYTGQASVLYSHIWREYSGDFVNRHFWGTDAEQRTSVSWRRENRQGYDLERTQGRMGLSTPLPRHWRFLTQYKVSHTVLYNVDPDISASEPSKPLQNGFSVGLELDDTDDYFFPTRGARIGTLVERQGGWFGGDVNLNRASARATGYWSPFASIVGAATFGGGVVRQFAPSDSVPIYERWFLGGATTVRGYREREIGEKDNLGNPFGGNVFTRGGVEVRFPLFWRVGGALFLDGGMLNAR
jgi:outer membrane protein insertion porin family